MYLSVIILMIDYHDKIIAFLILLDFKNETSIIILIQNKKKKIKK